MFSWLIATGQRIIQWLYIHLTFWTMTGNRRISLDHFKDMAFIKKTNTEFQWRSSKNDIYTLNKLFF